MNHASFENEPFKVYSSIELGYTLSGAAMNARVPLVERSEIGEQFQEVVETYRVASAAVAP